MGKLDEISGSSVVFFHNNFFQFNLGLGGVVERTEVHFEFVVEAVSHTGSGVTLPRIAGLKYWSAGLER